MQFLLLTQGGNSRMIEEVQRIVESLLASQRRENRIRRQSSVGGLQAGIQGLTQAGILKQQTSTGSKASSVQTGGSSRPGSPAGDLLEM